MNGIAGSPREETLSAPEVSDQGGRLKNHPADVTVQAADYGFHRFYGHPVRGLAAPEMERNEVKFHETVAGLTGDQTHPGESGLIGADVHDDVEGGDRELSTSRSGCGLKKDLV